MSAPKERVYPKTTNTDKKMTFFMRIGFCGFRIDKMILSSL